MVIIIENWAKLKGKVLSFSPNAGLNGFYIMRLRLDQAEQIEGFPNLAEADVKKEININIKIENFKKTRITVGKDYSFIARKASGSMYFVK